MSDRQQPEFRDSGSDGPGGSGSGRGRVSWLAALYVPVLVIAVCWIVVRDGWAGLSTRVLGGDALVSLGSGVVIGLVVTWMIHASPVSRARAIRRMRRFLGSLLPGLRARDAWVLAVASGVAEEMLFRGALQPAIGLVPSAVLFGALHLPPDRRLALWPVFACLLGLVFGGLVEVTGSLLGPMIAHVLINLVGLRRLVARG